MMSQASPLKHVAVNTGGLEWVYPLAVDGLGNMLEIVAVNGLAQSNNCLFGLTTLV